MELSERCIQTLENEGFSSIYEESRTAGEVFDIQTSEAQMSLFVTEGSLLLQGDVVQHVLLPGNRSNIPSRTLYSFTAGPQGCQYVIGEL